MADRDEKGFFIKGNKVAGLSKGTNALYKKDRQEIRREVIKCSLMMADHHRELKHKIQSEDLTNLEYLTANAIAKKDYKFIVWLLEMAIGKPKDVNIDDDNTNSNNGVSVQIVLPDNLKTEMSDYKKNLIAVEKKEKDEY